MEIEITPINQYNSTKKRFMVVNGTPVCCTRGMNRMNELVSYLMNGEPLPKDGRIKKILDKIRQENNTK